MCGKAFQAVHDLVWSYCWWKAAKQMNVVRLNSYIQNLSTQFPGFVVKQFGETSSDITNQNRAAVLRNKYKVVVDVIYCVSSSFTVHNLIITQERNAPIPHSRLSEKYP